MIAKYFNPLRKTHLGLVEYLEKELANKGDDIKMCKYGENTQHIFKNGKYLITIDWSKV